MRTVDIKRGVQRTKNRFFSAVKKVFAGIFGTITVITGVIGAAFIQLNLPVSVFFFCHAGLFLFLTLMMIKKMSYGSNLFQKDVKECEDIYNKICALIKSSKLKTEFGYLSKQLKEDIKDAKNISRKLDRLDRVLSKTDWDITTIDRNIALEERKDIPDVYLIKNLVNQKENVVKMHETEKKLVDMLNKIKQNLNSIYTKLTIVDTQDKIKMDEIETDIQKILDRKLMVSKFEEELDKELL